MNEHDPRYQPIMDFLGWATTQEEPLTLSAHHEAPDAIAAMERFFNDRPFSGKVGEFYRQMIGALQGMAAHEDITNPVWVSALTEIAAAIAKLWEETDEES